MSSYDLNTKQHIIKLPVREDYYSLVSKKTVSKQNESVVMTYITEAEEKAIDKGKTITLKRGNLKFTIQPSNIYCYGEIDFNNDSEDMDVISTFNWLDHLITRGVCVPSNYDYNKHECISINKRPMWYDTTKCELYAKYVHACLGKPKRCLIFRDVC